MLDDPIAKEFGERVRAARKRAGLTQESVAQLSGLDRTTISLAELGKIAPRVGTLIRIAGALEVDPSGLLPAVRWVPAREVAPIPGEYRVQQ